MSRKKIVLWVVLAGLLIHLALMLVDAGVFYQSTNQRLVCEKVSGVPGPEDFAFSAKLGKLFVSSDERPESGGLSTKNGGIFLLDPVTLEKTLLTSDYKTELHPHGIGLWETPEETVLYVVSHRSTGSVVEVFKWVDTKLVHEKTISDEIIIVPNDILPVGRDKFYLSHDHGSKNPVLQKIESYSRIGQGYVTYFEAGSFRKVLSGINFANGLAMTPDMKTLYLASMLGKRVIALKIKDDHEFEFLKRIDLDVAPDNITLDKDGNILVGAHAKLFAIQGHVRDHAKLSPFEILRIKNPLGEAQIETVMTDDGSTASGVSVAQEVGDYLFLGTIFQNQFLRCKK